MEGTYNKIYGIDDVIVMDANKWDEEVGTIDETMTICQPDCEIDLEYWGSFTTKNGTKRWYQFQVTDIRKTDGVNK